MHITKAKKAELRRHYIEGKLCTDFITKSLKLRLATIRYYFNEFRIIERDFPDKLKDYDFHICPENVKRATPRYRNLVAVLPTLVTADPGPVVNASELYRQYAQLYPNEYSHVRFCAHFKKWFDEHRGALCAEKLKAKFSVEELEKLAKWRKSNDHRLWKIAVVLMESTYHYNTLGMVAEKVECTYSTLLKWLRIYEEKGLDGLSRSGFERPVSVEREEEIKAKMDNLVHLVQQSPQLYGIDRASWKIADLAEVFTREYKQSMTIGTVSTYLKKRGIRYKRSREVISSPDPLFKEKYAAVQHILENLTEKQKFFSVDEYGPCSVRPKDGRMLTLPGEQPTFKGVKKGKGWFICTCALELSTNQVTHFYSLTKDTEEMIKLIHVLMAQYPDQEKLFISWDAASWHASKKLNEYLKKINGDPTTPIIVLAPLPARAPYLNVIESVFSGMSKSVIRNSDYASPADCKAAIDRYFAKRNRHFLENPQRAGNKIWGKERVEPAFNKGNICKTL